MKLTSLLVMFILERHILSFFLLVHTHVHTYLYSENPSLKLLSDQHLSGTDLQITEIFFIVGHRMDLKKKWRCGILKRE